MDGLEKGADHYSSMASSVGRSTIADEMKYMRQDTPDNMKMSHQDDNESIPMFESFKVCIHESFKVYYLI